MIRHFCDVCDNILDTEHPDMINPRWVRKIGDWKFELIQSYEGVSNTGNLCQPCLRNLLMKAMDGGDEVESVEAEVKPGLMEQLSKTFRRN